MTDKQIKTWARIAWGILAWGFVATVIMLSSIDYSSANADIAVLFAVITWPLCVFVSGVIGYAICNVKDGLSIFGATIE